MSRLVHVWGFVDSARGSNDASKEGSSSLVEKYTAHARFLVERGLSGMKKFGIGAQKMFFVGPPQNLTSK